MGKQVAINRSIHYTIELYEDSSGELYPVMRKESLALIKKEYHPIGKLFVFPKSWGLEQGCRILLETLIERDLELISTTQIRIDKMNRALIKISNK